MGGVNGENLSSTMQTHTSSYSVLYIVMSRIPMVGGEEIYEVGVAESAGRSRHTKFHDSP